LPGAQDGRNKSLLRSAAGRALQRNDIHSLHIDITWDPVKLQAFVQVNHAAVGLIPHPSVHCGIFKADDSWRHCILESNRLTTLRAPITAAVKFAIALSPPLATPYCIRLLSQQSDAIGVASASTAAN
jgi:hypothetical protein